MSTPEVTLTESDGALGVLPANFGKLLACVGVATAGSLVPSTFARKQDVIAEYTSGPLVEAVCSALEKFRRPVVVVRTGNSVAATNEALDDSGFFGTSVVTLDVAVANDDYELYITFLTGGTIGVAGITYKYSLDGGRTLSATQALGVATTIVVPETGGVNFDFAAGTVVAGDVLQARTNAPNWNGTEIQTALTSLKNSTANWEICEVVGPIGASDFDAIETGFAAIQAAHKERSWIGNTRMPDVGESEATYLASLSAAFASKATTVGCLCAGAAKITSGVNGRKYRRPISFAVAPLEASVSEEQNIAEINIGNLVGVAIRDNDGNPDEHDETVNPGLDDARFTVLRTWDGVAGVYVNRMRVFSAEGSDFYLHTHRRVMNIAKVALRAYLVRRCNQPIVVNATTGFILETEALEIEAGANAVLRATLLAKPKASAAEFTLSRTDNLLSTRELNGQARITPLAYAESIAVDVGFRNPALNVVTL